MGDTYRVLVGINYPPDDRRAEVGDTVNDLPDYAIKGLLKAGVIEKITDAPAPEAKQGDPAPAEPTETPEQAAPEEKPTAAKPEPAPEAPAAPETAPETPAEAPTPEPAPEAPAAPADAPTAVTE